MKILRYYTKSEIALKYYNIKEPGKYEDTEEGRSKAKKNFYKLWKNQTIDFKILWQAFKEIHKEQENQFPSSFWFLILWIVYKIY